MVKVEQKKTLREAIRFGVVGVVATALHWCIYYALLPFTTVNFAYIIGYALSFLCNFYLTSYFTFQARPTWTRLIGMAGAHGINFILHMVLLNMLLALGISSKIAPIPVFCIAVPVNFLLVRFVFQHPKRSCSK